MSRCTRSLLTAAFALLAVGTARAQAVPDLSGTWKLDPARSDFGPAPAQQRTEAIDHREPRLVVERTIDGTVGTLTYVVDGKPHQNSFGGGMSTSTLAWDGKVLVMTSEVQSGQGPVKIVDRFALSEDGKALTIARAVDYPGQPFNQTLVFAKQ
ncbi:MAG: hypothetical protein AB7R55_20330 [Gemmatimonadales bacterium]